MLEESTVAAGPRWSRTGLAVLLVVCATVVRACSNEQVYNAIQQNRQLECQKLPGTQYEECMREFSQPYKDYKRERDELTKDQP